MVECGFVSSVANVKGILDVAVSKRVSFYMLDICFASVLHFVYTCHRKHGHKLLMLVASFFS